MGRTLPLLFIVFGAFSGQSTHAAMPPGSFDPCATFGGAGVLSGIEKITDARAAPRVKGSEDDVIDQPYEGVVQIACLAAKADGDMTLNETSRIAALKRREHVRLERVAVFGEDALNDLVEDLDPSRLDAALIEAVTVIALDGQISAPEQDFFDALAKAAALPQHRLRVILGLSD